MAKYKYVNTDDIGMGEYSDMPSRKSRVIGEGQSKAGSGRGMQGGPTAAQADQNRGMMSPAERGAREDMEFEKISRKTADQGYKKGGHVHHSEHYGKHAAGFGKERDKVKSHAAGHKHHDDHVMAMCGGGKMK